MKTFGRYQIRSLLGQGGMATVHLAYDPLFKRDVAIKVLPRELLHDRTFHSRFEQEAQTIALLEHYAIVPVYDFGKEEGQPFLVMRYMSGGSLTERIKEGPLAIEKIAIIAERIGAALDRAHKRGIIHRDIKLSNILFDGDGDPYLSDFGLARLSEVSAQLTGSGIVGTPAYMAPEISDPGGLTHLVDVYAFGVTLFEMLTGQLPYAADTAIGMLMAHAVKPVPDVRSLRPELPATVQSVVERAMAKHPFDRYQSAGELAADLQAVLLPTGQQAAFSVSRPADLADQTPVSVPTPPGQIDLAVTTPLRSGRLHTLIGHSGTVHSVSWSSDGKVLASGSEDTTIILWDAETGVKTFTLDEHQDAILSVAFSPTDPALVSGSADRTVRLWNVQTGTSLHTFSGHTADVTSVTWSPDGRLVVSGSWDGSVLLFDLRTGKLMRTLAQHSTAVSSLAWSPDGTMLACGLWDGTITLWNTRKYQQIRTLTAHTREVASVAWSPDGTMLASGSEDTNLNVCDAGTSERLFSLRNHEEAVTSVTWSPDGTKMAAGSVDNTIMIWEADSGRLLHTLSGHTAAVTSVAWSPSGKVIASGSSDNLAILWDTDF
jgi:serine/threonine protein kinase